MQFRISKDKKLADVVEALAGAVALICGSQNSYKFCHHIGLMQTDFETLQEKLLAE